MDQVNFDLGSEMNLHMDMNLDDWKDSLIQFMSQYFLFPSIVYTTSLVDGPVDATKKQLTNFDWEQEKKQLKDFLSVNFHYLSLTEPSFQLNRQNKNWSGWDQFCIPLLAILFKIIKKIFVSNFSPPPLDTLSSSSSDPYGEYLHFLLNLLDSYLYVVFTCPLINNHANFEKLFELIIDEEIFQQLSEFSCFKTLPIQSKKKSLFFFCYYLLKLYDIFYTLSLEKRKDDTATIVDFSHMSQFDKCMDWIYRYLTFEISWFYTIKGEPFLVSSNSSSSILSPFLPSPTLLSASFSTTADSSILFYKKLEDLIWKFFREVYENEFYLLMIETYTEIQPLDQDIVMNEMEEYILSPLPAPSILFYSSPYSNLSLRKILEQLSNPSLSYTDIYMLKECWKIFFIHQPYGTSFETLSHYLSAQHEKDGQLWLWHLRIPQLLISNLPKSVDEISISGFHVFLLALNFITLTSRNNFNLLFENRNYSFKSISYTKENFNNFLLLQDMSILQSLLQFLSIHLSHSLPSFSQFSLATFDYFHQTYFVSSPTGSTLMILLLQQRFPKSLVDPFICDTQSSHILLDQIFPLISHSLSRLSSLLSSSNNIDDAASDPSVFKVMDHCTFRLDVAASLFKKYPLQRSLTFCNSILGSLKSHWSATILPLLRCVIKIKSDSPENNVKLLEDWVSPLVTILRLWPQLKDDISALIYDLLAIV